jgi:hypothetical protein
VEPSPESLRALAGKYRALLDLRRARDQRGHGPAETGVAAAEARARLRALAGEFPGCLRELDTLGAPELERRAHAVTQAAAGGSQEPWMAWIVGYHALMRSALGVRRSPAGTDAAALATSAEVDAAFIAAVRRPPQGRLGIVVLRALGTRFGVEPSLIAATLFPPRRQPPYRL